MYTWGQTMERKIAGQATEVSADMHAWVTARLAALDQSEAAHDGTPASHVLPYAVYGRACSGASPSRPDHN